MTRSYTPLLGLTNGAYVLTRSSPSFCRFYLATDERNATFIEYYKEHGAVMIQDLLTAQDRRDMDAWPLVFTDVLGVLEQTMLARASTFYGHALSRSAFFLESGTS